MSGFYFFLGLMSVLGTWCGIVQARRLYWLAPVYFFTAWLTGELALIHLLWQVGLTSLLAFTGLLGSDLAQAGLGLFALSWIGLVYLHVQAMDSNRVLQRSLRRGLGEDYRSEIPADRRALLENSVRASSWMRPFSFERAGVRVHSHVAYAEAGKRNLLDIYQSRKPREGGCPVLLQVHGGGWVIGKKEEQAKPLMFHLAERGWICVSINYRLSPDAAFPAHIVDVEKGNILGAREYCRIWREP